MFSSCWAINSIEKVVGGQKSWEPSKGWLRLRKGQILQTTESWVWVNTGAQHSCYQEWAAHGRVPLVILTTSTAGTALCSATTFLTWQRLLRQMFYPEFQLSNSPSRVNKILLAAFLHPGSVHEISWLDHFTAALGVLQLITQIFTFSEGKTKCIRLKSENLFFPAPSCGGLTGWNKWVWRQHGVQHSKSLKGQRNNEVLQCCNIPTAAEHGEMVQLQMPSEGPLQTQQLKAIYSGLLENSLQHICWSPSEAWTCTIGGGETPSDPQRCTSLSL